MQPRSRDDSGGGRDVVPILETVTAPLAAHHQHVDILEDDEDIGRSAQRAAAYDGTSVKTLLVPVNGRPGR